MPEQDIVLDTTSKPKKLSRDEEKTLVKKYYTRFLKAEGALGPKQEKWKILDLFDRAEQWDNSAIPPWVPKPVTNWIRYIRTLKRANLASAIPKPTFTPEFIDDTEIIQKLQKAHDHVWEQEKVPRSIRRAIDRAKLFGTSIGYVYTDDNEIRGRYFKPYDPKNQLYQGRIRVKLIPITNFFPDPDGYRLEDCKFIEVTEVLPLETVLNNPLFREYAGKKLDKIKDSQLENSDSANGTIFQRSYQIGTSGENISGDELVTLHTHWERYTDEYGQYHINVSYYLRDFDFFLYRIEDVKPNEFPFAVLYDEEEDQDFHGRSDAMDILENQKIINKVDQVAAILGVLHQNPQKVVSRESGINAQELARTGNLPGKVWVANGDPAKAIHYTEPPDIPRALPEIKNQTSNDIREMVGINEAYTGQSVGSLTTSTGVNSLIERSTLRDRDKMIQIDEFVERISHLIVLHILHKWKEARPLVTTGPDGKPEYDEWQPMDELTIENLSWRVKSDVYAKAPVTQAARKQQADALMQMQGQFQFNPPIITPEEWIQFQDFDMKEQILQRMRRDRARLEQEKALDMAQIISQTAQIIQQATSQGMPPQQAQQMAYQFAQQILMQKEQEAMKNGRPADQPQPQQGPRGTTGQLAMMAMAKGV